MVASAHQMSSVFCHQKMAALCHKLGLWQNHYCFHVMIIPEDTLTLFIQDTLRVVTNISEKISSIIFKIDLLKYLNQFLNIKEHCEHNKMRNSKKGNYICKY